MESKDIDAILGKYTIVTGIPDSVLRGDFNEPKKRVRTSVCCGAPLTKYIRGEYQHCTKCGRLCDV
jgi:hypothetical protein